MLCPCCSAVFYKEAVKVLEKANPYQSKKGGRQGQPKDLFFKKRGVPQKPQRLYTYVHPSNVSLRQWFGPARRLTADKEKWKLVEVGVGSSYLDNSHTSKKYSYISKNYLGKNPMTRTQWRRNQKNKKFSSKTRNARVVMRKLRLKGMQKESLSSIACFLHYHLCWKMKS